MERKYLTLSSKNQITLNKEVRDALDIESGDKVYFENSPYGVLIKKAEMITTCPICNGDKVFLDDKCLICDGEGTIKEDLTPSLIAKKLINILMLNNVSINIATDNELGYIINSIVDDFKISRYINECQMAIIKISLSKFIENKSILHKDFKDKCIKAAKNFIDEDDMIKTLNEVQLEIVKAILKEKSTITQSEYEVFVNSFDDKYKSKVSNFLITFISL